MFHYSNTSSQSVHYSHIIVKIWILSIFVQNGTTDLEKRLSVVSSVHLHFNGWNTGLANNIR